MIKFLKYWYHYNLQKFNSEDWEDSPSFIWFIIIIILIIILIFCPMLKNGLSEWVEKKKEFWSDYKNAD
jgi:hypothetical protein